MPIHTDALGLNGCFTPHLITARGTVHHVTEHWIPISSLVGIIFSVSLESPHCVVWLGPPLQRVSNGCFLADEDATLVLNTALAGESRRAARTKQWIEVVRSLSPLDKPQGFTPIQSISTLHGSDLVSRPRTVSCGSRSVSLNSIHLASSSSTASRAQMATCTVALIRDLLCSGTCNLLRCCWFPAMG